MSRRDYRAPPDDQRCEWDITLRADKSGARCMRRKVVGNLCRQHAAMRNAVFCEYCGGNDDTPPDHTQDCTRPDGGAPIPLTVEDWMRQEGMDPTLPQTDRTYWIREAFAAGMRAAAARGVQGAARATVSTSQESKDAGDVHRRNDARQDAGRGAGPAPIRGADRGRAAGTLHAAHVDLPGHEDGGADVLPLVADGAGDRRQGSSADDEVAALLPRIDAAIERITTGRAPMRVPAEDTDPDLVLADCKRLLRHACGVALPEGSKR